MDGPQTNGCAAQPLDVLPQFAGVSTPEGLTISGHLFLLSLMPCCAQLALPFWAKVTGDIANDRKDDLEAVVSVALLDGSRNVVERYSDRVLLDRGETSNFEVKLIEFRDRTVSYRLEVDIAEAP